MPHFIDDWRYRWWNNGVAVLPKKPCSFKELFVLDTEHGLNNEFKQNAYQQVDKCSDTTIIHYIGDETVAAAFTHRNRTKFMVSHVRACPSYLAKCAKQCETMKPGSLYKEEISPHSTESLDTELQWNLKNLHVKFLSENRVSKDEFYNLHEIAFDIENRFV